MTAKKAKSTKNAALEALKALYEKVYPGVREVGVRFEFPSVLQMHSALGMELDVGARAMEQWNDLRQRFEKSKGVVARIAALEKLAKNMRRNLVNEQDVNDALRSLVGGDMIAGYDADGDPVSVRGASRGLLRQEYNKVMADKEEEAE